MSMYDDMIALRLPTSLTTTVSSSFLSPNCRRTRTKTKTVLNTSYVLPSSVIYMKYFGSARILFLAYLILSPVSGVPTVHRKKSSVDDDYTLPSSLNLKGHPWKSLRLSSANIDFKTDISKITFPKSTPSTSDSLKVEKEVLKKPKSLLLVPIINEVRNSFSLEHKSDSGKIFSSKSVFKLPSHQSNGDVKTIVDLATLHSRLITTTETPLPEVFNYISTSQSPEALQTRVSNFFHIRHPSRRSLSRSMDNPDTDASGRTHNLPESLQSKNWNKPCRTVNDDVVENVTPKSLSARILSAVHEAKSQINSFVNRFYEELGIAESRIDFSKSDKAQEVFGVEKWEDDLSELSQYSLVFLNNTSGIDLSDPSNVSFNIALEEAYEMIQRRGIGFQEVIDDESLYEKRFITEFEQLHDKVLQLHCELRHALIQSGLTPKEIPRDVMSENLRNIESGEGRKIRDGVIVREYVRGLRILHNLFDYYAHQTEVAD